MPMNLRARIAASQLRQLYVEQRRTIQALAQHYRVSETTIRRRLKELAIPTRARGRDLGARRASRSVERVWSPVLAYAVGVIATDGNLSPDGRHLTVRSQDYQLLETLKTCLGLENRITTQYKTAHSYYSLQWGDRVFYRWLESIGLMPAKSLVLGALAIPDDFFPDVLRGVIDGDGCIRVYQDNWNTFRNPKYSYARVYVTIASGSFAFVDWLRQQAARLWEVKGAIIARKKKTPHHAQLWELKFAKKASRVLFRQIYYANDVPCLARKRALAMLALEQMDS